MIQPEIKNDGGQQSTFMKGSPHLLLAFALVPEQILACALYMALAPELIYSTSSLIISTHMLCRT